MDLRSVNPQLLDSLDAEIEARVARAAEANRVRWSKEVDQRNAAGGTADALADRARHPLVLTAVDVYGELGLGNRTNPSGSTDANMGVVRGIPSIAVGRGVGGGGHTLSEWAERASALPATKAIVRLAGGGGAGAHPVGSMERVAPGSVPASPPPAARVTAPETRVSGDRQGRGTTRFSR